MSHARRRSRRVTLRGEASRDTGDMGGVHVTQRRRRCLIRCARSAHVTHGSSHAGPAGPMLRDTDFGGVSRQTRRRRPHFAHQSSLFHSISLTSPYGSVEKELAQSSIPSENPSGVPLPLVRHRLCLERHRCTPLSPSVSVHDQAPCLPVEEGCMESSRK